MIAAATSASRQSTTNITTVTPTSVSTCWKKKIEAVAEEEAHGLEVDRRPRHQLARLVAVVEAEREPEQLRVEPLRRSNSTPSACRPEIRRRPTISSARARPTTTTAATRNQSSSSVARLDHVRERVAGQERERRSRRPACRPRARSRRRATTCTAAGSRAGGRRWCDSAELRRHPANLPLAHGATGDALRAERRRRHRLPGRRRRAGRPASGRPAVLQNVELCVGEPPSCCRDAPARRGRAG